MYPLCADATFIQDLRQLDRELFLTTKAKGCPYCGGPLDTANYTRKTRGMAETTELCFSLCCRTEGCRKRTTPRSLRFFGRKVYGAWVVILALDFCTELGLSGQISRQTIGRWKAFWRERLSETSRFMRRIRGLLPLAVVVTERPISLVVHFDLKIRDSWISILNLFCHEI